MAVFQWGWGASLIGLEETVPIIPLAPMLMFAILFGLSMDYEVFLLSRVREQYLKHRDPQRAVVEGVGSTARVITSAALIMISVFGAFVLSTDVDDQAVRRRAGRRGAARRDAGPDGPGPGGDEPARRTAPGGCPLARPGAPAHRPGGWRERPGRRGRRDTGRSRARRPDLGVTQRQGVTPVERVLLSVALVVGAAHVLDESLWHRSTGVAWNRHLPGVMAVTGVVAVLLLVMHRLGPPARAAVAGVAGTLVLANGSSHVVHVWLSARVEQADITGILAAVAGVLLLGVAVRATFVAWRHRSTAAGAVRLWVRLGGVALTVAAIVLLALVPVVIGIVQTHSVRQPIGGPPGKGYRSVHFDAADGLHLEGWYRASTNGAGVVLVSAPRAVTEPRWLGTRDCWPATATASCCTTPAAPVTAMVIPMATAGVGIAMSSVRCPSSSLRPTYSLAASGLWDCPPAPTFFSRRAPVTIV